MNEFDINAVMTAQIQKMEEGQAGMQPVLSTRSTSMNKGSVTLKLDKISLVILIITVIVGLALLIPGIVIASGGTGSGSSKGDGYQTITLDNTQYVSNPTEQYYYYKYKHNDYSNSIVYILIDGGSISQLREESANGNRVSRYVDGNSDYDKAYYFYPEQGSVYYIKVYSDSNTTLKIRMSKSKS